MVSPRSAALGPEASPSGLWPAALRSVASDRLEGATESVDFNANNNTWLSTGSPAAYPNSSKLGAILLSAFAEAWDEPRSEAYAVRCAKDSVPGVHEPMPW